MTNTSLVFDGPVAFSGNSAELEGGAIFVMEASSLSFDEPLVVEHNSAKNAGALEVLDSSLTVTSAAVWQHNQATETGGFGGVMRMFNSTVSISNDREFRSNRAGSAGAIYVESTNLVLDGPTLFWNNSASLYGGAILSFSSDINITMDAEWINNHAGYIGGAVSAADSMMRIKGEANFSGNTAAAFGGAFGMLNTTLLVDGSLNCKGNMIVRGPDELSDIAEVGSGGAIYTKGSAILVGGVVSMDGNEAITEGGGIFLSTSTMEVSSQLRCAGNTAASGGAIAVAASVLSVEGTANFSGNSASQSGGAAWVLLESAVNIAGDAFFEDNSAGLWRRSGVVQLQPDSPGRRRHHL